MTPVDPRREPAVRRAIRRITRPDPTLLLDEAEALGARRGDVRGATDRYAAMDPGGPDPEAADPGGTGTTEPDPARPDELRPTSAPTDPQPGPAAP